MRKYIISIIGVIFIMQSSIHATDDPKAQLLKVDKEFSDMSDKKGMAFAFDFYMDDSAMMLKNNMAPVIGREAINKIFANSPLSDKLTWEPIFASISESNDLGYTIGQWTYVATDSLGEVSKSYGHYVSIWKKQNDGSWKYVFDTGTSNGDTPHD